MQQVCIVDGYEESMPENESGKLEKAFYEKCTEIIEEGKLLSHAQGNRCVFAVVAGAYYACLAAAVKTGKEASADANASLPGLPEGVDVGVQLSEGHRLGYFGQGVIGVKMNCFAMVKKSTDTEKVQRWRVSECIPIGGGRMPTMLNAALVWTSRSLKRKFLMVLNRQRYRSFAVLDVELVVSRKGFLGEESSNRLRRICDTSRGSGSDDGDGKEDDVDSNGTGGDTGDDGGAFGDENDVDDDMGSNDTRGGGAEDGDGNSGNNDSKFDDDNEDKFFLAKEELKGSGVVSTALPFVSYFAPPSHIPNSSSYEFPSRPATTSPHTLPRNSPELPELALTERIRGGGSQARSQEDEIDQDGFIMGGFDLRTLKDSNLGVAVLPMAFDAFAYEDFDNYLSWRTISKTEQAAQYGSEQTESPQKDHLLALVLSCIGGALHSRKDLEGALREYQKALVIQERLSSNSLRVADTCKNIGDVMKDQNDKEGALDMYLRALTIQQMPDSLAPHWQVAETRADIEQMMGPHEKASLAGSNREIHAQTSGLKASDDSEATSLTAASDISDISDAADIQLALKSDIQACRTIDDFVLLYEKEEFEVCLKRLENALSFYANGKDREERATRWAQDLLNEEDDEAGEAAHMLNND